MSRNITFKDMFIKGAIIFNPVLIQLVGLCPVVAASTSITSAAALSLALCADLIVTCVIASALFKKIPRWVRVALYLVIGLVMICPVLWFAETKTLMNLSLGVKIYLPLVAINSVTAVHCEQFAVKNDVKLAFFDAAAVGIGGSIICMLVGAIREIFGSGSLAGVKLELPVVFKGMAMPFGCLILLGFMAAGLKAFVAYKYPQYSEKNAPAEKEEKSVEVQQPQLTEVEIFDEFMSALEQEEQKPDEQQEIKELSKLEIDEFIKSLGIDLEEKGDKQ